MIPKHRPADRSPQVDLASSSSPPRRSPVLTEFQNWVHLSSGLFFKASQQNFFSDSIEQQDCYP